MHSNFTDNKELNDFYQENPKAGPLLEAEFTLLALNQAHQMAADYQLNEKYQKPIKKLADNIKQVSAIVDQRRLEAQKILSKEQLNKINSIINNYKNQRK